MGPYLAHKMDSNFLLENRPLLTLGSGSEDEDADSQKILKKGICPGNKIFFHLRRSCRVNVSIPTSLPP